MFVWDHLTIDIWPNIDGESMGLASIDGIKMYQGIS